MRAFKSSPLSNFQKKNSVLLITAVMQYLRPHDLFIFIAGSSYFVSFLFYFFHFFFSTLFISSSIFAHLQPLPLVTISVFFGYKLFKKIPNVSEIIQCLSFFI